MSIENSILGKKCTNCGNKNYPVRSICPSCRNTSFEEWIVPKEGTIFSYTTVNFPLDKYEYPPYYVGLIAVDSNNSLITARIINNQDLNIGQKVKIDIKTYKESGSLKILTATPV